MRFCVLGPLEVYEGERVVKVGGGRERALLALLLVHAKEIVSRDRLIDELWHGTPPPGAAQSLDAYVSRIRRAMRQAGADGLLATRAPGYVLDAYETDVRQFEAMVRKGREALAAGDPERAAPLLREALGLWRGAAYVEVADETWARPEAARLEDLRLAAIEDRADAELALGAHASLVQELELLASRHPTRERLVGQLMVALYRAGRQADALAAYRAARESLVEELGLEPGPELRRLEAAVLAHHPSLDIVREDRPKPDGRAAVPGERRQVTVLVAEVVGNADARSRERMVSALRAGVHRLEGTVDEVTGRGIVALFGARARQEDHARRACYAALHLRHELGTRVRIGLSPGHVAITAVGDDDRLEYAPSGDMLDLAHALERIGKPGMIYLPENSEPLVDDWSALDDAAGGAVPLPSRLHGVPGVGYVGRVAERERLAGTWKNARDDMRQVVMLSGEPGVGKTRLASHTALELLAEGANVLYGHSEEELAQPYGAWVQALSHYVEYAPRPVLEAHIDRHGGELGRLLPILRRRMPDMPMPIASDRDTERYLMFSSVLGLLEEACARCPTVLILDDLHCADKPSLSVLKHVAAEFTRPGLLVIGTYRDSELSGAHPLLPLLAELDREEGVERLRLEGLTETDVVEMMTAVTGHELAEPGVALARAISAETGGNAFFVSEILRHLSEARSPLDADDGHRGSPWDLAARGMPQSVREVVARRVARLGAPTQALLRCAAVIGRDFDVELLARVARKDEGAVLDLLEAAVAASVLVERSEPGAFSFAHALVNHTLYDDLGATRRARLHHGVGVALEEVCGHDPGARVTELARHWSRATTPVDLSKAISYSSLAGARAIEELAPDEAVRWFTQALDLLADTDPPDARRRCALLIDLGTAQRQAGDPGFRATLLEASRRASEVEDADLAAGAALANTRGWSSAYGEVDGERIAALERAIELGGSRDTARRARLLASLTAELLSHPDHDRRAALARQALELARDAGDRTTLAYVLRDAAFALERPETLAERRTLVNELSELALALHDPALDFWASMREFDVRMESAELRRAAEPLAHARALADELGQPLMRWCATYCAAGHALAHGDLDEAERLAEQAVRIGNAAREADAPRIYGATHAAVCIYQGRAEEIVELMEHSVAANPGIPAWRAALAETYCWLGRTEDAAALVAEARADGFAHVPHDATRNIALAFYAGAATTVGDVLAAGVLYDAMEGAADQFIGGTGPIACGHVRLWLGLLAATLGRHDLSDEHLRFASDFHDKEGALLWAASGRQRWAEALARRGERTRSTDQARLAFAAARENGYAAIEQRAAALLEEFAGTS